MRIVTNILRGCNRCFKSLLLTLCVFLFSLKLSAQEDPLFTQYLNNLATINPAYVGAQDAMNIKLLTRMQWTGFEGAPMSMTTAFTMPYMNNQMGFGGRIVYDRYGPITQTGFYVDYAYHLFLDYRRGRFLSFGISGGFNLFSANIEGIGESKDDPVFMSDQTNKILPNFGLGIMYRDPKFLIGISVPKLIQSRVTLEEITTTSISKDMMHIYFLGAYKFRMDRDMVMKLATMVQYIKNTSTGVDLHVMVTYRDNFTAGLMYTSRNTYGMSMQFNMTDQLRLGYAYDMTSLKDVTTLPSTHEIMVSYDIPSGRRSRYRRRRHRADYFF
ncbi:type IX secretion system membrane protein PorP/SprF [Halosquirtibacter laminarini]|uniref:Type IX secretion system membrane protein PorP/SprF n=1 Tax=Halosquirtibacter laminarini TaxID=3374600 RepID=A0AC61NP07_9BACT|nr:type IX secretion system membrane protein PorP/SprF [Prolixibacteraceae bacterium]